MYHSLFSGAMICHWGRAGTQIERETLMLGEEIPLHQWSACSDPLRRERVVRVDPAFSRGPLVLGPVCDYASSSIGEETETIDIKNLPEVTNLVSDKPRLKSLQLTAFHRRLTQGCYGNL